MDFGIALPTAADSWRVTKEAEELGFTHLGPREGNDIGDVLDDQGRVDQAPGLGDVPFKHIQRLVRERHRGEVADVDARGLRERDMLAPPGGIEAPDQPDELAEVDRVEPFRPADQEYERSG